MDGGEEGYTGEEGEGGPVCRGYKREEGYIGEEREGGQGSGGYKRDVAVGCTKRTNVTFLLHGCLLVPTSRYDDDDDDNEYS